MMQRVIAAMLTIFGCIALLGCSSTTNSVIESFTNNLIAEDRYRMILDGLQVTLLITFCAMILRHAAGRSGVLDAHEPSCLVAAHRQSVY